MIKFKYFKGLKGNMRAKFPLFLLILLFLGIPLIFGYSNFTCLINKNPEISPYSSFNWICNITNPSVNENIKCLSYTIINGDVLDVNPKSKDIDSYGRIDSFYNNYGLVNIKFDNKNLRNNVNISGCVICSNNSGFSLQNCFNITPQYTSLEPVAYRLVWLGNNWGYVLGLMFFIFLIIFGILIFKGVISL